MLSNSNNNNDENNDKTKINYQTLYNYINAFYFITTVCNFYSFPVNIYLGTALYVIFLFYNINCQALEKVC